MKKSITKMILQPNDCVAIVGCGGKTTLMYKMAEELRNEHVLVTTTTRIYPPSKDEIDYTFNGFKAHQLLEEPELKPGRYLIYDGFDARGKLIPPETSLLQEVSERFDYTVIESDGSKGLPVKGYHEQEPCVPNFATITVGVATIWAVGEPVDDRFVHRVDEYCEMTGAKPGKPITLNQLSTLIAHPNGPFKQQTDRRILFINHLNMKDEYNRAMELVDRLPKDFLNSLQGVIAGNLHTSTFEYLYRGDQK